MPLFGIRQAVAGLMMVATGSLLAQEPIEPVGQAPEESATPDVAAVFEERGLLTPRGRWVVEPSLSYNQTSSVTVAVDGFTLIPALAIGLIDISELQRDTLTTALALRYGLTNRIELGVKVPHVWRQESLRSREVLVGSELDRVVSSSGDGLGDIEFGLHYQINRGVTGTPFLIGNLRVKSRTGSSPFEVERIAVTDGAGVPIAEILTEQPTGSGFWAVQPSLSMIYPSDPAVLFANVSYLANLRRDINEDIGWVDPGDSFGASVGMGLALNSRLSTSFGYDHSVVMRTRSQHATGLDPVFSRLHVGTFLWGLSHRVSARTTFNLSVGIGATSSAPDVQLAVRLPVRF